MKGICESCGCKGDLVNFTKLCPDCESKAYWGRRHKIVEDEIQRREKAFCDARRAWIVRLRIILIGAAVILALGSLCQARAEIVNGDLNGDGHFSITDLVYGVRYIFASGPAPVDLYAHIDGAVDLRWIAPPDSDLVGCQVRWGLNFNTVAQWDSAQIVPNWCGELVWPSSAGKREGVTVNNLDSGMTYFFGIKFVDSLGAWSDVSNIVEVRR